MIKLPYPLNHCEKRTVPVNTERTSAPGGAATDLVYGNVGDRLVFVTPGRAEQAAALRRVLSQPGQRWGNLRAGLEIVGTGYRAELKGQTLNLALGFSHPVSIALPNGVTAQVPAESKGTQLAWLRGPVAGAERS